MVLSEEALHKQLPTLMATGQRLQYLAGQTIFYKDHLPLGLYLLILGDVTFPGSETPHAGGHVPQPRFLDIGATLAQTPHSATCTALTDVVVVFIARPQLHQHFID
jgi:hypothetical protein